MSEYKGPIPNQSQIKYHNEEMACFMHFGMNTFTEVEWGNGRENLSDFKLKEFDYDGYVKFVKDLGVKRIVFTAKHHDGFCMFNTKYTNHNIMNTEYGKDFLKELSRACTKYDMDMGLYLSPWDAHEPSYGKGKAYNEFYQNQLIEICSNPEYGNNGKFVEWWFDGAKDPDFVDQEYNFDRWIEIVKTYNPDIIIFGVGSKGGIHWLGNEMGYAPEENAPRLRIKEDISIDYNEEFRSSVGHNEEYIWSVPEADTTTTSGWFSHPNEKIKSLDELKNIYFKSIGRGAVLLLNIAPNKEGKISLELKERLLNFKEDIDTIFSNKLNNKLNIELNEQSDGNRLEYKISNPDALELNYLEIMEDIEYGSRFMDGFIFIDEERINVNSIGYKRIINLKNSKEKDKIINNIRIILNSEYKLKIKGINLY